MSILKFEVTYNTAKLRFYANTKDRIDKLALSYIVYRFCCPGCCNSYIGKTEWPFFKRINKHAFKDKNSVVQNHVNTCDGVNLVDLLNIDHVQTERDNFDKKVCSIATIKENSIIDRARWWEILLFKEALHIKEKNPTLVNGLKTSKELKLF